MANKSPEPFTLLVARLLGRSLNPKEHALLTIGYIAGDTASIGLSFEQALSLASRAADACKGEEAAIEPEGGIQ